MKTQLGMYKTMQNGGIAPEINVSDDLIKKIRSTLVMKNFHNDLNFNKQGFSNEEFDYKICYNEKHKDKLFVISQIKTFDNQRLVGHKFKIYCYDFNGDKVNFNQDTDCIDGFYENCYIIKDDLL